MTASRTDALVVMLDKAPLTTEERLALLDALSELWRPRKPPRDPALSSARKRWTAEEDQKLIELRTAGADRREVARILHRSHQSISIRTAAIAPHLINPLKSLAGAIAHLTKVERASKHEPDA